MPKFITIARVIGILYMMLSIFVMLTLIPNFVVTYKEILDGDPLPQLTNFIVRSNPYLWLVCGFIPGLFLLLGNQENLKKTQVRIGFFILFIILTVLTVIALSLNIEIIHLGA